MQRIKNDEEEHRNKNDQRIKQENKTGVERNDERDGNDGEWR